MSLSTPRCFLVIRAERSSGVGGSVGGDGIDVTGGSSATGSGGNGVTATGGAGSGLNAVGGIGILVTGGTGDFNADYGAGVYAVGGDTITGCNGCYAGGRTRA